MKRLSHRIVLFLLSLYLVTLPPSTLPTRTSAWTGANTSSSLFVWRKSNGPEGGQIIGFGVSANYPSSKTAFVAVDGDIYNSQIGVSSWGNTGIGNLPADLSFTTFAMSPKFDQDHTLFLAGYHNNTTTQDLYVSTDSGATWASRISSNCSVIRASPQYQVDNLIVAGCAGSIFRSINGGISWAQSSVLVPGTDPFLDIDFSPAYSIDSTVFAILGSYGIYRSTNQGVNWSLYQRVDNIRQMSLSPGFSVDSIIYAATTNYFWTNRTGTWATLTLPPNSGNPVAIVTSPNYVVNQSVFAGTTTSTLISNDGGSTWNSLLPFRMLDIVWSPNFSSDNMGWLITNGAGVFETNDGGNTWVATNGGLAATNVTDLSVTNISSTERVLFAGVSGGGIYTSTDNGINWKWAGQGITDSVILSVAPSPFYNQDGMVFAGSDGHGVFRSTNGGLSWKNVGPTDIYSVHVYDIAVSPKFDSDSTVIAATNLGTYRSIDRGQFWDKVQGSSAAYTIAFSPNFGVDDTVVVGTNNGIIISNNGGATWDYHNEGMRNYTPPYGPEIAEIVFSPNFASDNTIYAGTALYSIYKSTNGGLNWNAAYNGMLRPNIEALTAIMRADGSYTLYASARLNENNALYKSSNQGGSWTQIITPFLGITRITALATISSTTETLLAGVQGKGVWHYQQCPSCQLYLPIIQR